LDTPEYTGLFVPSDLAASAWATHGIGWIGLTALLASNSLPVRGVVLDGAAEDGKGVCFETDYLMHFIHIGFEQAKNKTEATATKNCNSNISLSDTGNLSIG
jgi:hypothetical protein